MIIRFIFVFANNKNIPINVSLIKLLFASGADDFLAMLDGKIREGSFFKGSI